jgi:hypothetical protein
MLSDRSPGKTPPIWDWMQPVLIAFDADLTLCWKRCRGYTLAMDSVRFGRALGIGTRLAAKTLASAVDAATAPNPSAKPAAAPTRATAAGTQAGQQVRQAAGQVKQTREGLRRGGKRFGEAVWGPFVKLSGVLWLELTGVFFGIFALFAASEVWKQRANLRSTSTNHDAHQHFLVISTMAAVFGYFFVTSFVKAHRRGKRR